MNLNCDPVIVTRDVMAGIMTIKDSQQVNMCDLPRVIAAALEMRLDTIYQWLAANGGAYAKGFFCGFITDPIDAKALN